MNVCRSEIPILISARTSGCKEKNEKTVVYSIIDSYHGLCLDKKDIIISEWEACKILLKYSTDDNSDSSAIEEMAQLQNMS